MRIEPGDVLRRRPGVLVRVTPLGVLTLAPAATTPELWRSTAATVLLRCEQAVSVDDLLEGSDASGEPEPTVRRTIDSLLAAGLLELVGPAPDGHPHG